MTSKPCRTWFPAIGMMVFALIMVSAAGCRTTGHSAPGGAALEAERVSTTDIESSDGSTEKSVGPMRLYTAPGQIEPKRITRKGSLEPYRPSLDGGGVPADEPREHEAPGSVEIEG